MEILMLGYVQASIRIDNFQVIVKLSEPRIFLEYIIHLSILETIQIA